jgi:hypothetical protein
LQGFREIYGKMQVVFLFRNGKENKTQGTFLAGKAGM